VKKFVGILSLLLIVPVLAVFSVSGKAGGAASSLPVVGSLEKLKSLLEEMGDYQTRYSMDLQMESSAMPSPSAAPQDGGKGAAPDSQVFSATNVQVQGVDEADIVKTDGKYIYQVNKLQVIICKAHPPESMKVLKTIQFGENDFSPQELYVDSSFLVVIGTGSNTVYPPPYPAPTRPGIEIYPVPPLYQQYVKAIVYDIRDKNNIKKAREVELAGNYVSSRKIGSALYLVSNKYIDRYRIMEGQADLPAYRDSAAGNKRQEIGLDKVCYFPGCSTPNYMLVAGIDLNQAQKPANVSSYLGSGENIYVSQSALYAVVSLRDNRLLVDGMKGILPVPAQTNTGIYKFTLNGGNVSYQATGKVPGTVLNQFSMDAYKGYFRVATTTGQIWRQDEGISKNNIYVLDGSLKIAGKIENIAPGEKIYSARFVGDRAYMVTFKNIDPFFVIDLSSPKNPKILGALKIPGYSDYLHPVDGNHVLGFGKDTVEEKWTNWDGQETSTAYYQGMKIALFDVSDVSRPVEKFKTVIGDRGTDSPLLHDHKALLFDKDEKLLAFPVTVTEVKGDKGSATAWGEFVFQGAYVYSFSVDTGFSLRGKITHLDNEDYLKSGHGWYRSEKDIYRVLYIGDTLYTVSDSMIMANDLSTMAQMKKLLLP